MAEILSQSQIDSLLSSLIGGANDDEIIEPAEPVFDKKVRNYDFRNPKLFTREQLKVLSSIYENYAKLLSSHITGALQTYCKVEIAEIEEQHYYEFNNALPDSVLIGLVDMELQDSEEQNIMIMDISKEIGFCIIDRSLGGPGRHLRTDREYTEIEIGVLEYFVKGIVNLLKNVWKDYLEITPLLTKIETNSRILQVVGADENVVIVVMNILVNETQGKITVCIPAVTLDIMFKKRASQTKRNIRKADQRTESQRKEEILNSINETSLEIRGILGSTEILSKEIVNLEVGDIIKLQKPVNAPVNLEVDGSPWFTGDIGVSNKKLAVAIKRCIKERK